MRSAEDLNLGSKDESIDLKSWNLQILFNSMNALSILMRPNLKASKSTETNPKFDRTNSLASKLIQINFN